MAPMACFSTGRCKTGQRKCCSGTEPGWTNPLHNKGRSCRSSVRPGGCVGADGLEFLWNDDYSREAGFKEIRRKKICWVLHGAITQILQRRLGNSVRTCMYQSKAGNRLLSEWQCWWKESQDEMIVYRLGQQLAMANAVGTRQGQTRPCALNYSLLQFEEGFADIFVP